MVCSPPSRADLLTAAWSGPRVAYLFTQMHERAPGQEETLQNRLTYFKECLSKLELAEPRPRCIAFVLPIVEPRVSRARKDHLAAQARQDASADFLREWRLAVQQFATTTGIHVNVVSTSEQFTSKLRTEAAFDLEHVRQASREARATAGSFPDPYDREIALALVTHIEDTLETNIFNVMQGADSATAATVAFADGEVAGVSPGCYVIPRLQVQANGRVKLHLDRASKTGVVDILQQQAARALSAAFALKENVVSVGVSVAMGGLVKLRVAPLTSRERVTRDFTELPPQIAAVLTDDFAFGESKLKSGLASPAEYAAARAQVRQEVTGMDVAYRDFLRDAYRSGKVTEQELLQSFGHHTPETEAKNAAAESGATITVTRGVVQAPGSEASVYCSSIGATSTDGPVEQTGHNLGPPAAINNPCGPMAEESDAQYYWRHHPRLADTIVASATIGAADVTVSSASGPHIPAKLLTLKVVGPQHLDDPDSIMAVPVATQFQIREVIDDSGSATTLLGAVDAEEWERKCPGCIRTVKPLLTSVRRIKGIGPTALNLVLRHVEFTLDIGGALVKFVDVPVLNGHSGLLLGNEFAHACRVVRDNAPYTTAEGLPADGFIVLRRASDLQPISRPVPFCTRSATMRKAETLLRSQGDVDGAMAVAASASVDNTPLCKAEQIIESAVPIAFAPQTVKATAWAETSMRVRVPAAALLGHDLAVLPLEDDRLNELGVMLAPCLARPDKDGYITVRLINPSLRPVVIPVLTPIGRFIVDPRIAGKDIEYTVDEIMERCSLEPGCTEEDRALIKEMIKPRRRIFASTLGWAHGYRYEIKTPLIDQGKAVPPSFQQRKRAPEELAALEASIKKQLKLGLLEPVISPYGATPMLIKKPPSMIINDKGVEEVGPQDYRVVLDYRALNALVEGDVYPLPNIETNLAALGKAKLFTTADLLMGFHQIELTDDSVPKTALNTPFGQFAYRRLPMGLTSAPGAFMRLVDASLRGLPAHIALCYVDDVIIFTDGDMAAHMKDVGLVFDKLIESGFTVKCEKVHIGKKEVPYLGFLAGAYGTRPDPKKTQPILDIALEVISSDVTAATRYVGMLGHYRRFLPNLHIVLKEFHDLRATAANAKEILGSLRFQAAFAHTKYLLSNITALARPDMSKPFYIDVDSASSNGVGAILSQRTIDGDPASHLPIAVYSRRFNDQERGYGVRDQECLGLSDALEEWRSYVGMSEVIVRTDHKSLQWLLRTSHQDGSRVAGYALKAQNYNLEIEWVPGKDHAAPDFFSRDGGKGTGGKTGVEGLKDKVRTFDDIHDDLSKDVPLAKVYSTTRSDTDDQSSDSESDCSWEPADPELETPSRLAGRLVLQHLSDSGGQELTVRSLQIAINGNQAKCCVTKSAMARRLVPRAAALFLRRTATSVVESPAPAFEVLVECQGGVVNLPHSVIDLETVLTYREQFSFHFLSTHSTREGRHPAGMASLLRTSTFHKRWHGALAETVYYSGVFTSDQVDPVTQLRASVVSLEWRALDDNLLVSLSHDDDFCFASIFRMHSLQRPFAYKWHCDFKAILNPPSNDLSTLQTATVMSAQVALDEMEVPSLLQAALGPAFIQDHVDWQTAASRLWERHLADPSLTISVDLEGALGGHLSHISLIQVCIDASPLDPESSALVYVFDSHVNTQGLRQGGSHSLRALLETASGRKVLHCCNGDSAALFYEFGITLQNIWDTGIADCLLIGRHWNRPRNLEVVMRAYLGDDVIMQLKGTFDFIPGMFNKRPIAYKLFLYSYEDVLFGNQLYAAQHSLLKQRGLLELCCEFSRLRCPPRSLPAVHRTFQPASKAAIALVDGPNVLCLRNLGTGLCSLPMADLPEYSPSNMQALRAKISDIWRVEMGVPPRFASQAINAKLQKPVRIGDIFLYLATVPSLAAIGSDLVTSFQGTITAKDSQLAIRDRLDYSNPAAGTATGQHALFQYLHVNAESTLSRKPSTAITSVAFEDSSYARAHISAEVHNGEVRVRVSFSATLLPQPLQTSEVNVVLGPVNSNRRAALIVTDGSVVYALRSVVSKGNKSSDSGGTFAFPSAPVEITETEIDPAFKAFDIFAGSSIRRTLGATAQATGSHALMPVLSAAFIKACENPVDLGLFGNTQFFSITVSAVLTDHLSSFYAARREVNGFRLTKTLRMRYEDGVFLVPFEGASDFHRFDRRALEACVQLQYNDRESQSDTGQAYSVSHGPPPALPSSPSLQCEPCVSSTETEPAGPAQYNDMPPLGEDPSFDALFEARVLLHFAHASATAEANLATVALASTPQATSCSPAAEVCRVVRARPAIDEVDLEKASAPQLPLPQNNDADAVGQPPKYRCPSSTEVLEEQLQHPALRALHEFHLNPELRGAAESDWDSKFRLEASRYHLGFDGLLMRKSELPLEPSRIVLPHKFHSYAFTAYHDRQGHLGISRCMPLLSARFYWDSASRMKEAFSSHIRNCRVCAFSKVYKHPTGEMQMGSTGHHPMDYLSVDTFTPGIVGKLPEALAPVVGKVPKVPPVVASQLTSGSAPTLSGTSLPKDPPPSTVTEANSFGYDRTVDWVCHFSKGVVSSPAIGDPSSEEIAYILVREIIRHYGTPRAVRSDRGSAYISAALQALYKRYGIKVLASSSYHHQSVAIVERWHATLKQLLLTQRVASADNQWHLQLPLLELAFNATVSSTTGYSPFFVMYLRHAVLPNDMLNSDPSALGPDLPEWVRTHLQRLRVTYDAVSHTLRTNSLHQKKKYDLRRDVNTSFNPGDRIALVRGKYIDKKLAKAENPLQGPYTVERRLPRDRYLLTDLHTRRMHNVVHVSRMQMYPDRKAATPTHDSQLYPVSAIVGRRVVTKPLSADTPRLEYQIKWVGFGQQQKSWRAIEYLTNVYEMVAAYNRQLEAAGNPLPAEYQPLLPALLRSSDETAQPAPHPLAIARQHFRPMFSVKDRSIPVAVDVDPEDAVSLDYLALPRVSPSRAELSLETASSSEIRIHLFFNPLAFGTPPPTSLLLAPATDVPLVTLPAPRAIVALEQHRAAQSPSDPSASLSTPDQLAFDIRLRRRQARLARELGIDSGQ